MSQSRERVQSTEQEGVAIAEEVPRIDVEIPRCLAKLGTDQYFVKLPNFLSVDTRYYNCDHTHYNQLVQGTIIVTTPTTIN